MQNEKGIVRETKTVARSESSLDIIPTPQRIVLLPSISSAFSAMIRVFSKSNSAFPAAKNHAEILMLATGHRLTTHPSYPLNRSSRCARHLHSHLNPFWCKANDNILKRKVLRWKALDRC